MAMKVIFDCNIWISFLIGHHAKLIQQILTDSRFNILVCEELLEEIHDVSSRSKIQCRVSEEELDEMFSIIHAFCDKVTIERNARVNIRDPKDLYLLSLAETVDADFVVTGDADLLDLKGHKRTRIITFAEFKELFGR